MSAAALFFASGDSLYAGVLLLLCVIVASQFVSLSWFPLLRSVISWVGLALAVVASPPFPYGIDAAVFAILAIWFAASRSKVPSPRWRKLRAASAVTLCVSLIALCAVELRHRQLPFITGAPSDHLVVIGDSISAGIDSRSPAWPMFFQLMTAIRVKNLARMGAEVPDALKMADEAQREDRLVLIEIGGNDLIAGISSTEFSSNLESLLRRLTMPGRTIAMFELPLLPTRIGVGQSQRRLASQYGVWLIPKRCFTDVLGGANATSDGLHLSPQGARKMAALVAKILAPVLQVGPHDRP